MTPVLYLDLASPYAYLAAERAGALFPKPVDFRPILLGAIFKQRGRGSWADSDHRAAGMAEVEERARRYGLPALSWPPEWPCNSLAADRAAVWAREHGGAEAFMRAVYRHEFTRGADIAELGVLQAAAEEAGLDAQELAAAIQRPEIKQALREATDEAWALGVRGVPSVAVAGTVFYGDDRLEDAALAASAA